MLDNLIITKDSMLQLIRKIQDEQQRLYADRVHQIVCMLLVAVLALLFKNDMSFIAFIFTGIVFITGMACYACEIIRFDYMSKKADYIYWQRVHDKINNSTALENINSASKNTHRTLKIQVWLLLLMLIEIVLFYIITLSSYK